MPVGEPNAVQNLVKVARRGEEFVEQDLGPVRFVPLIGAQGWSDSGG
jgi:protein-L-isoaspartate O-methyltransferase